ncbi:hypothetical protein DCM91_20850 [Chitinophaga costaii]|nr:hypothetical protein DCM91_20850 [Chitinophaga costaii]
MLFYSCGTTGHIVFYNFDANKYDVEREILNILNRDSIYIVPDKWREHIEGDYFERIYIYFKSNPEELYQIGFTGDAKTWKRSMSSKLGLISIYNGKQFLYETDLSNKEQKRIQNRLEKELLSKIKYTFKRSN